MVTLGGFVRSGPVFLSDGPKPGDRQPLRRTLTHHTGAFRTHQNRAEPPPAYAHGGFRECPRQA